MCVDATPKMPLKIKYNKNIVRTSGCMVSLPDRQKDVMALTHGSSMIWMPAACIQKYLLGIVASTMKSEDRITLQKMWYKHAYAIIIYEYVAIS